MPNLNIISISACSTSLLAYEENGGCNAKVETYHVNQMDNTFWLSLAKMLLTTLLVSVTNN
jgi:hypothetical protein